jgi:molybdopterin synthase catalytic subunit
METNKDLIRLQGTAIDVPGVVASVGDDEAGGVVIFLGTTRSDEKDGARLAALEYEAYAEMAVEQMRGIAKKAGERWPVRKVAIVHRTGRVGVGEPSVAIAVSAPHRDQAFEACRFLIDSLKREVAVWKKEIWTDGSADWVEGGEKRD